MSGVFAIQRIREYISRWRSPAILLEPPAAILASAVWFGLFTGLAEVALLLLKKYLLHSPLFMGRDFLWLTPVVSLVVFTAIGLVLSWGWRLVPGHAFYRFSIFTLALLSFFSLLLFVPKLYHLALFFVAAGLATQFVRLSTRHPRFLPFLITHTTGWPSLLFRPPPALPVEPAQQPAPAASLSRRDFLLGAGAVVGALALTTRGVVGLMERSRQARLPSASPNSPNVLLVVMDTVRAQNLGLYGYQRPTSPNLDRIARSGVVFEKAISTAPWTLPSHASMFTGHFPGELGTGWLSPMNKKYLTLAEVFSDCGYLTAGFVGNTMYCSREFGLQRGFSHYEGYGISVGQAIASFSLTKEVATNPQVRQALHYREDLGRKPGHEINERFREWLDGQRTGRPFFAFLNYFDAHNPYLPPHEFAQRFCRAEPSGARTDLKDAHWTDAQIRALQDDYDASVAYVDSCLEQLHEHLEAQGRLEDTVLVIVADHGEQFGEHGLLEHGNSLFTQTLHVPLVVVFPNRVPAGLRVPDPVSLHELPATIAGLPGVPGNAHFPGSSLARFWGDAPRSSAPKQGLMLSELEKGWQVDEPLKSIVYGGLHYMRSVSGHMRRLYDVVADPLELNDLSGTRSGSREAMQLDTLLRTVVKQGYSL